MDYSFKNLGNNQLAVNIENFSKNHGFSEHYYHL